MNKFLIASARADSRGLFEKYMIVNAVGACIEFFLGSIILTVAIFLSPTDEADNFSCWIWLSFAAVVFYSWDCSCLARRKSVLGWVFLMNTLYIWIIRVLAVCVVFYCGVWSIIHPSGRFSFEPHWNNVLFIFGGLLAYRAVSHISNVHRAIAERTILHEAGHQWKP
jgi:hypothetical protein